MKYLQRGQVAQALQAYAEQVKTAMVGLQTEAFGNRLPTVRVSVDVTDDHNQWCLLGAMGALFREYGFRLSTLHTTGAGLFFDATSNEQGGWQQIRGVFDATSLTFIVVTDAGSQPPLDCIEFSDTSPLLPHKVAVTA